MKAGWLMPPRRGWTCLTICDDLVSAAKKREREREGGIEMDIKRNGSRRSGKGPAEWFTGTVRIETERLSTAWSR